MNELARVVAQAPNQFAARVYIYDPTRAEQTVPDGTLWKAASRIPGAQVLADRGGAMARAFGAETSGMSLLYDPSGRLLFCGGITGGRGHEGDNANEDALLGCLQNSPPVPTKTHTYGCSIF